MAEDDPGLDLARARYARFKAVKAEEEARRNAELATERKEREKRAAEAAARNRSTHKPEDKHMAESSKFDKMLAEAHQATNDKIEEELVRLGVDRAVAVEFIEREVALMRMPGAGLKITPHCGDLFSRGWSDNCLIWFARQLNVRHPEFGGKQVAPGPPPEYDAEIARRERVKRDREAAEEREKELLAYKESLEQEAVKKSFVDHITTVRGML